VHSADGWRGVLEPVIARYRCVVKRRYFRGDAPPPTPRYTSSLKPRASATRPGCRPTVCCKAGSGTGSGARPGGRRLYRDQLSAACRAGRRLLQPARARRSNGSKKARARSSGRGCHARHSRPTPCAFSSTFSRTTSATSCGRWQCRKRRSRGR